MSEMNGNPRLVRPQPSEPEPPPHKIPGVYVAVLATLAVIMAIADIGLLIAIVYLITS